MAKRPLRRNTEPAASGSVRSDELLTLAELKRRLSWGDRSVAAAQRAGLRAVGFGRQKFVLGADVIAWLLERKG